SRFAFGRTLARRIPNSNLARNCTALMWVNIALLAVFLCFVTLPAFLAKRSIANTGTNLATYQWSASSTMGCAAAALILIYWVWLTVIIFRFRAEFQEDALFATRH